jgi:hypothetical protein
MSAPRFARYLTETGGDRDRALSWYEWNIRLGNALMRDIAHFEVALRNAYDQALIARSPAGAPHWGYRTNRVDGVLVLPRVCAVKQGLLCLGTLNCAEHVEYDPLSAM